MYIDLAFLLMALIGFITGFRKGLLHSIFFLAGIIIGIYAALHFSVEASQWLQSQFDIPTHYLPLLAFTAVFLLVCGLLLLVATILESVLKLLKLNLINRLAGAVIWLILYLVLFSTALWFLNSYRILPEEQKTDSRTYPYISNYSPYVMEIVEDIIPLANKGYDQLDSLIQNSDLKKEMIYP